MDELDEDNLPEWRYVTFENDDGTTVTNGRVAYMVINGSGCLDPNRIGGEDRTWSTNINEINISSVAGAAAFVSDREDHVRYETVAEVHRINTGLGAGDGRTMLPYSLDIGKDLFFTDTNQLGYLNALLTNKFQINSITNYDGYYEPENFSGYSDDDSGTNNFMDNYYTPLHDLLDAAGLERPADVTWNIVNYLDTDRIPQCALDYPWRHTEGNEAIPLINEIVFRVSPDAPPGSNHYEFAVELWYPFAPVSVLPTNNFMLQVGVFTTNWTGRPQNEIPIEWYEPAAPGWGSDMIMDVRDPDWSFDMDIENMSFGTTSEFIVVTSPEDRRISFVSNGVIGVGNNAVWMLARVVVDGAGSFGHLPVDEAMGYHREEERDGDVARRALKKYDSEVCYEINDPRVNGQCRYWDPEGLGAGAAPDTGERYDYTSVADCTLGYTNRLVTAWDDHRTHGTPIWAKNGLMLNIAEIGHIYRSNLDDEMPVGWRFWRNVDLMHQDEGAALLDWITVRNNDKKTGGIIEEVGTNYLPLTGLVNISSRQYDSLYALINELWLGTTNEDWTGEFLIDPVDASNLVEEIIYYGPYLQYRDLFWDDGDDDGGPIARAFRQCASVAGGSHTNDILLEDTFRHIAELITFRQNMFQVLVAAQSLAKDGESVVGEKRALATVVRDSYTGVYYMRSFKWLDD